MKEQDRRRAVPKSLQASKARPRSEIKESKGPGQNSIFGLQRAIGNQAVAKLLGTGTVQAKLRVSQPGDADEIEADRIADQVVGNGPASPPSTAASTIHRKCGCPGGGTSCPACEEEQVEHKKGIHRKSSGASPDELSVRDDFLQSLGPGQPLDPGLQKSMESRFGRSFEDVRVHHDSKAADLAGSINARAFASGRDVVFGSHEYAPDSSDGKKLLAHELAHVAQQSATRTPSVKRQPAPQVVLTQALYDQAVALIPSLPGASTTLVRILRQGKVGQRVANVQVTKSTQLASGPSSTTAGSSGPAVPSVAFAFDLEISPNATQVPQGAFATFIDDPANQTAFTGSKATGQVITRLLQIATRAPSGANAANTLATALVHEGTHMLLAVDQLLENLAQDPGIAAGMSGALKSFNQYRQAGNQSALKAPLVGGLVQEINRVSAPPITTPSTPPPGTTTPPPPLSSSSSSSTGPSPTQIANQVIDRVLAERFAIDQQKAHFPQSAPTSNNLIAQAYLFTYLASEAGVPSWPTSPNTANLITQMTAFLDSVTSALAPSNNPPPAPSQSSTSPPKKSP